MVTLIICAYLALIAIGALFMARVTYKATGPTPRNVLVLFTIFILGPMVIAYLYLSYFAALPETTVPDVRGLNFDTAKDRLENLQLHARIGGSIYEVNYPEGVIAAQRPEAGRKVKAGRIVNLMVSSGQRKVIAPNLLGRPILQIGAVLSAAELLPGEIKKEHNADAPEGTVLAQEPLPGEETEAGKQVDILISTTLEGESAPAPSGEAQEKGFKLW
jgi:serine/threonine-protein kinase